MTKRFIRTSMPYIAKRLACGQRLPGGTTLVKYNVDLDSTLVSKGIYGGISVIISAPNPSLSLGCYCSTAHKIVSVASNEHMIDRLSALPFNLMSLGHKISEVITESGTDVGNDVRIGFRAMTLDDVSINQRSVVVSVAAVTKDEYSCTIVADIPARPIRKLSDENAIEKPTSFNLSEVNYYSIERNDDLALQFAECLCLEEVLGDTRGRDEL